MAAVSVPQASSSLTPPASSHGGENSWAFSVPAQTENFPQSVTSEYNKHPISQANGHSFGHKTSQSDLSQKRVDGYTSSQPPTAGHLAPARINALSRQGSNISDSGSASDSLLELYGANRSGVNSMDNGERKTANGQPYSEEEAEHSRWIHRDKLARIESQELQAAGIILPRTRAASKSSRREGSRDQQSNGLRSEQGGQKRKRMDPVPAHDQEADGEGVWDLRRPEEASQDLGEAYLDMSGGVKGVSRIPILKTSPLPIPMEQLERDTLLQRKLSGGQLEDDPIMYSKSRGRSQSIKIIEGSTAAPTPAKRTGPPASPTKRTPATRKGSVTSTRATSAPQKPKVKTTRNTSSGQRPTTRSGELGLTNNVKRPEGDPPWLASMYKPDPRLPPDQQLLPTVAKRLQQEQWEKEGKFGTVYDTEFRPLNNEEVAPPDVINPQTIVVEEPKSASPLTAEWPLRSPRSPAMSSLSTGRPGTAGRTESYSTMPRLAVSPHTGIPQGVGPLPSPKPPIQMPEPPEENNKSCGCCVVM